LIPDETNGVKMKHFAKILFLILLAASLAGCPFDRVIDRLTNYSYNG